MNQNFRLILQLVFTACFSIQIAIADESTCISGFPGHYADRYNELSDGNIHDKMTDLVWKRCVEGSEWDSEKQQCNYPLNSENEPDLTKMQFTWQEALTYAQNDSIKAEKWRVPDIKELASLLDYSCLSINSPFAIDTKLFDLVNNGLRVFWSASPLTKASKYISINPDHSNLAYSVIFYHYTAAGVRPAWINDSNLGLRLVKSIQK